MKGEARKEIGSMGNPVVHFEIRARDLTRQKSFYSALFAWELGPESELLNYSMIDTNPEHRYATPGAGIPGGIMPSPSGSPGLTFYVQVDNLEAALARAHSLGASTVVPPTKLPVAGARFAVISDLEGNELGLLGV